MKKARCKTEYIGCCLLNKKVGKVNTHTHILWLYLQNTNEHQVETTKNSYYF